MKRIETLEALKKLAKNEQIDCFIAVAVAGGLARSSKSIFYSSKEKYFSVKHEMDWTEENMTEAQLLTSNIGKALEVGALYAY